MYDKTYYNYTYRLVKILSTTKIAVCFQLLVLFLGVLNIRESGGETDRLTKVMGWAKLL